MTRNLCYSWHLRGNNTCGTCCLHICNACVLVGTKPANVHSSISSYIHLSIYLQAHDSLPKSLFWLRTPPQWNNQDVFVKVLSKILHEPRRNCRNVIHFLLVSTMKSLESDQHKCKRKFNPEELKLLVEETNSHFYELQLQITPMTLRKPATAKKSRLVSFSASWVHQVN